MPESFARPSVEGWIADDLTPSDIYLHYVHRTLADIRTPYQNVRIIDGGALGLKLFLNDVLQSASSDEFIYHESLVHPALLTLCAARAPRKVLILGGGEGATLREVARWRTVQRIVMVDIDQDAVETCRRHLSVMHQGAFDDRRVEMVFADAADYVRLTHEQWDVVISDITEPVEAGPSNFCFTREFFAAARDCMAADGVLVTQSGPVTPALIRLHARVTRTLDHVFDHVRSYAASVPSYAQPWGFTLASDAPLTPGPSAAIAESLLQQHVAGELRFLDGAGLAGMLCLPRYVREAIATETRFYSAAELPEVITA
jgi:spermidine synthase